MGVPLVAADLVGRAGWRAGQTWNGSKQISACGIGGVDGALVLAAHVDRDGADRVPALAEFGEEALQGGAVAARRAPHDRARWRGRRPRSGSAGRGGVGVDGGAPCQPCGWWFLRRRPPNRTCEFPRIRLSTSASSGWCPLVQLALNVEYPLLSLIETRQPRASVHRRPPRVRTCCAFAATLPHVPGFPRLGVLRSLRHTPAATADGAPAPDPKVRRAPPGCFPRSPSTGRQGRRPAIPRWHCRATTATRRAASPARSLSTRARRSRSANGTERHDSP